MSEDAAPNVEHRTDTPGRLTTAVILALCVAFAFALRAWALWRRAIIDYDETYYYMLGLSLFAGKGYVLNGLPHTAFPPLYPIFVGFTSLFTDDIRMATSLISAVAGALLPLPVYFLAKDIHGRRAALFAAWAAAVWRWFLQFAAVNVYYSERMYFGSEPLYVTLLVTGVLFCWRFARRGGWMNAALAGAFCGLASLVRSEGPVVFAFLFVWLVLDAAITRKLIEKRRVLQTAVVAAAMLAVFSPWLIHVYSVTGRLTLGAKLANNARIRDTLWEWTKGHDNWAFMQVHYRLNAENTQLEDPYWGVSEWHRAQAAREGALESGLRLVFRPDWKWFGFFTDLFWNVQRPLVPRYALILMVIGAMLPPWSSVRLRWWLLFAFNILPMALLALSLYALPRHELPLLALFSVSLGKGLEALMELFRRAAASVMHLKPLGARLFGVVPAAALLFMMCESGISLNMRGNRRPGVDVGLGRLAADRKLSQWLKAGIPPGSTLMCNQPWVALWAGMEWRVSPVAQPSRLIEYARNAGIDFAVLYPWQFRLAPEESSLLEPYRLAQLDLETPSYVYDFRKLRDHQ